MQLHVTEFLFRGDVAVLRDTLEVSVFHSPADRHRFARVLTLPHLDPFRHVFAVEQDDCIRRRLPILSARSHTPGSRPVDIVDAPLLSGNYRCIGVPDWGMCRGSRNWIPV